MGDGPRRPGKTRFSRSWQLILSPSWEAVYHSDDDDIDDFDDGFAKEKTFRVVMKWLSINTELWCLVVATVIAMTMIIIETDCWS